jgi:hypothetical protein
MVALLLTVHTCSAAMYDVLNDSDLRKVREWLAVRGLANCDNYQKAD